MEFPISDAQANLVAHVHLKDGVLRDGRRVWTVPGEGADPWPALIARLTAFGYAGDFSLKYERRWLPVLGPASAALPRAKAFVERCLAEARQVGVSNPANLGDLTWQT